MKKCNRNIKIQIAISELPLLRAILQVTEDQHPDLLLVGIDHLVSKTESYIGQQAIAIARVSPIPVLIIPAGIGYEKIKKALVPCDFAMVSRLSQIKNVTNPIDWLHPELMILNIDPKKTHLSHEKEHLDALKDRMTGYEYEIYYAEHQNTVKGILDFAEANSVQLITALPGRYSFFNKLTHRSITEAITLNAQNPVLVLK